MQYIFTIRPEEVGYKYLYRENKKYDFFTQYNQVQVSDVGKKAYLSDDNQTIFLESEKQMEKRLQSHVAISSLVYQWHKALKKSRHHSTIKIILYKWENSNSFGIMPEYTFNQEKTRLPIKKCYCFLNGTLV